MISTGFPSEVVHGVTGDDLLLPVRAGVPDELAYLRAAYPQPGWRSAVFLVSMLGLILMLVRFL